MDRDDTPVGRLLTRREMVALLAASGAAVAGGAALLRPRGLAAAPLPGCVVVPEQTEGPYFVDERLDRSDIRSDPSTGRICPGVPLALTFMVSRVAGGACEPLPGAMVDVWHCDGRGLYSGVTDPSFDSRGQQFLRGYQVTSESGAVTFTTIYPGWYPGRAVHMHFKVRAPAAGGRTAEFTSQVYFDEAVTDRVHRVAPYAGQAGRRTRNAEDRIYRQGGDRLMVTMEPAGEGFRATFALGMATG